MCWTTQPLSISAHPHQPPQAFVFFGPAVGPSEGHNSLDPDSHSNVGRIRVVMMKHLHAAAKCGNQLALTVMLPSQVRSVSQDLSFCFYPDKSRLRNKGLSQLKKLSWCSECLSCLLKYSQCPLEMPNLYHPRLIRAEPTTRITNLYYH